ncbi:hypothetical protein [Desulfoplanes sp.]
MTSQKLEHGYKDLSPIIGLQTTISIPTRYPAGRKGGKDRPHNRPKNRQDWTNPLPWGRNGSLVAAWLREFSV